MNPQRAYSRGYGAALNRVRRLEATIARIRAERAQPDHDSTIEYLVSTSEAFVAAAEVLIKMRMHDERNGVTSPNDSPNQAGAVLEAAERESGK